MARLPAYRSFCQNPSSTGEDEPASLALTEDSDTYTLAYAMSRTPNPVPAPIPVLPLALTPIDANATVRYSEADL